MSGKISDKLKKYFELKAQVEELKKQMEEIRSEKDAFRLDIRRLKNEDISEG